MERDFMTDEQTCAQLYRDLCDASVRKDTDAIRAVLAPGYALVHMTGMRQPKAAFLKAVANGTLNYSSAEHDSMEVTMNGETAILIGKSRVHAAVFGGGWHTWRLEQDLHLVKKENRWLITLAEASTY